MERALYGNRIIRKCGMGGGNDDIHEWMDNQWINQLLFKNPTKITLICNLLMHHVM
jgi:hypothetical protein